MAGDDLGAVHDDALPSNLLHLLDVSDRRKLTTSDVTRRLADALSVAERVLGVDRVGLMLLDENDDLQVVGTSDAVSDRLERAQQRLRVGPAWDSVHSGRTVAVDDLAATGDGDGGYAAVWRWIQQCGTDDGEEPEGTPGAVPVRAVLSAAVRSGGEAVGSLNAMRAQSGPWTGRQIRAVQACADVVGTLLALSASAARPRVVPDPGHNG
jgi:GAF domain-containing protein